MCRCKFVLCVGLIAATGLLASPSAPAAGRRPKPVYVYAFRFQGDGTDTFHEHYVNSDGCTGDTTGDFTASWLTTWNDVALPPPGHTRTYEGKAGVFTGSDDWTFDVAACGGGAPIRKECTGEPSSGGSPVRMTITAERRDTVAFSIAISAVGRVKDDHNCSIADWPKILTRKFSEHVPRNEFYPGYPPTRDLGARASSQSTLPGGTLTAEYHWNGTVDITQLSHGSG
jgi:hypothetical protein